MGNLDDDMAALAEAGHREYELEVQAAYDEMRVHLADLRESGEDAFAHLMYRTGDYEHPVHRRPEHLVEQGLSGEQITDLVRVATDDPQERFDALNDFAKIFAGKALNSGARLRKREERIITAFDLKDRATEELIKGTREQA